MGGEEGMGPAAGGGMGSPGQPQGAGAEAPQGTEMHAGPHRQGPPDLSERRKARRSKRGVEGKKGEGRVGGTRGLLKPDGRETASKKVDCQMIVARAGDAAARGWPGLKLRLARHKGRLRGVRGARGEREGKGWEEGR